MKRLVIALARIIYKICAEIVAIILNMPAFCTADSLEGGNLRCCGLV